MTLSFAALKKVTKANFSPVLSYNTRSATGDGSTTTTTVTSGTTVNDVIVLLNGVVMGPYYGLHNIRNNFNFWNVIQMQLPTKSLSEN